MTSNRLSRLRFAIASLGLSMFALPAMAQTPVPGYAERLAGKDVRVTADGVQHRGVVSSLSTSGLVLMEDGAPATIPFSRIARVEKVTHRVRNGTLLGLAAGAGLGVWVGLMCEGDAASGCAAQFVALLTGIGAGAGAGVGALVHAGRKRGDVLYEAPRRTPTVSFAPILSRSRKGVAFVVAWR